MVTIIQFLHLYLGVFIIYARRKFRGLETFMLLGRVGYVTDRNLQELFSGKEWG